MRIPKEFEPFFKASSAKTWLTRSRGPRPGNIFPSGLSGRRLEEGGTFVTSLDPAYLAFTAELAERASKEFPTDVLPSGHAGPSGVPGDFSAILSVTRYGMDPLPIPFTDNASFLDSVGKAEGSPIATRMIAKDRPWFDAIMDALFGYAAPTDLHIRKEGSTSFPSFTKDNQEKKFAALHALRESETFLALATSKETSGLVRLLNEYHTCFLTAIHERQQPDSWSNGKPKPRTAPTEEEARNGTYTGKHIADKRVFDANGNEIEGHAAMRRRDVFGSSGPMNYWMSAIMNCYKSVFMKRFAFTYMTSTATNKEEKLGRFAYVVGSDVKTMDKTIPRWFADDFFDRMTMYLDERAVEVMRRAFRAPFVAPSPWRATPAEYNPCFGGSPFDSRSFVLHPGLPSGVAYNPIFGRVWMTFVYVTCARDLGVLSSPAQVPAFLEGKLSTVLLDAADDAAWGTNDPVIAQRLRDLRSPYAILEPETPLIYLGDVFCLVGGKLRAYPNPNTYLSNILAREDSITDPYRWAEGIVLRQRLYSAMPVYRELNALYEATARKHLGFNPNMLAASFSGRQGGSTIDAMVLDNPAVLHYKVDPSTVSPAVLDSVVATIPHGDWFDSVKHLFRVPIQ